MSEKEAFYKLKGHINRSQFLLRSWMISVIVGVSFLSIGLVPEANRPVLTAGGVLYGPVQSWFHGIPVVVVLGPLLVLLGGLACLWFGLLYGFIFTFGSAVTSLREGSWATLWGFLLGLIMLLCVVLGCASVLKRSRDVLGNERSALRWSTSVCLASLIPFVGTISYWILLLSPSRPQEIVPGSEGTRNG